MELHLQQLRYAYSYRNAQEENVSSCENPWAISS